MTPVLEIERLTTTFPGRTRGRPIRACDDVSLKVGEGEIVGLVGESGCGKTTLGRSIVGLERPSAGRIVLDGVDLGSLRGSELRTFRRGVQYVFQDAYASLSPRQTAGQAIDEALRIAGERAPEARRRRIEELLSLVGLPDHAAARYPRELSGGQRQRVAIARALVMRPKVLICDEPVSSLDLSIRAQVMNLLLECRRELGMACLFISHDLAVVRQAAQRVLVMYLGRIVERAPSDRLYRAPGHPYTQCLLSAIPDPDPRVERVRERIVLSGDLPSPADPPSGCRFRTRCPAAVERCASEDPAFVPLASEHSAACHFAGTIDLAAPSSRAAGPAAFARS